MTKLFSILFTVLLLMTIWGCYDSSSSSSQTSSDTSSSSDSNDDSDDSSDDSGGNSSSSVDPSVFALSVAEDASTYDTDDIVDNIAFDIVISIDFSENTVQLASAAAQEITAGGITLLTVGDTRLSIAQTDYGITLESTLAANIKLVLTGELDGTFSVSSDSDYQLYLDGVAIAGYAGPALDLESSSKVYLVAASDTVNTLSDSSTRSLTMKAALYGNGPMIFSGDGSIVVDGVYKHGIFSKDYIRVRGTVLDVAVSVRDAIRSVNGFIFDDGDLTINATGTATDDESKGIKVEGSESEEGAGKGYIVINGGYIDITSVAKAVTAGWDIDDDAETSTTSDDPAPYVEINNGVIAITTTGTPYEYASGGTTVSCSPEGIEGKTDLTINSGYLIIHTTDDALNAGESIVINGGYCYCASSDNDAIDSNGTLTIAGGVLVAVGATVPEGAFDCDQNTFAITGGTFVGIGGALSKPTESACTQNAVILGRATKGLTLALEAADGTVVFAFEIPRTCEIMLLSSPGIVSGTRYTVYTGGTASADEGFNGLFLGSLSYAGGTAGTSFTVTSCLTNLSTR